MTNPSVIFADEPTTGLDSFIAENVMRIFRHLADRGETACARAFTFKWTLEAKFLSWNEAEASLHILCDISGYARKNDNRKGYLFACLVPVQSL